MSLSAIRPSTVALGVAAAVTLLVGTYTENGGFQLAGALFAVVAGLLAFNQARSPNSSGQGPSE